MPNMAVGYARPNLALRTLNNERIARWGSPARASEFVTGYKSPSNLTGHNPDSNGIVHAVDIFVGPGNLTEAQGIWLAEFLRAEGPRGDIPGHPDRLYYIIHRGRIAGDFTGWEWVPYGGADGHWDHIHVSTADLYWGDPVGLSPLEYDSTLPWGLLTASVMGGGITEIGDELDMASVEEVAAAVWGRQVTRSVNGQEVKIPAIQELADTKTLAEQAVANTAPIDRDGKVSLRQEVADSKTMLIAQGALLRELASRQGVDPVQVEKILKEAASEALASVQLVSRVEVK